MPPLLRLCPRPGSEQQLGLHAAHRRLVSVCFVARLTRLVVSDAPLVRTFRLGHWVTQAPVFALGDLMSTLYGTPILLCSEHRFFCGRIHHKQSVSPANIPLICLFRNKPPSVTLATLYVYLSEQQRQCSPSGPRAQTLTRCCRSA